MKTNSSSEHRNNYQSGAVLIVALLILLVLTILGVVGLGNMTLEERMAAGYQHAEITFQASDSAANSVIALATEEIFDAGSGAYIPNPDYVATSDPLASAVLTTNPGDTSILTPVEVDTTNVLGVADVATNLTMIYDGTNCAARDNQGYDDNSTVPYDYTIQATANYQVATATTATSSQTIKLRKRFLGSCGP